MAPARQPHADIGSGTTPETELSVTEPATERDKAAARVTEAITDVEQAPCRLAYEQASRQARSDYAARISREAEAPSPKHTPP
jgi:hypothetical protein